MPHRLVALLVALVGPSCTVSADPNPGSPAATGVSSDAPTTTDDGSSSQGDESSSGDDGDASTDEGIASETSGTSDTTGTDDGSHEDSVVCSANPTDLPCTACSKTYCCTQLETCWGDPDCSCFMNCAATSPDVFACGTQCGVDLFAPGPVGDVVSCSGTSCMGACP